MESKCNHNDMNIFPNSMYGTIIGFPSFSTFAANHYQNNSSKSSPLTDYEVGKDIPMTLRPFLPAESLWILQISRLWTLLFSLSHKFSVEFKSEDWEGHEETLIWWLGDFVVLILMLALDHRPFGKFNQSSP